MKTLEKTTTKPKQKIIGSIFETYDYDMFSFFKENRDINLANVEKLKKSYKQKRLLNPILVDGLLRIIDGQHTFTVCKELGLPIQYIIDENATVDDIPRLNTITKTWSQKQYLEYYKKRGFKNYQIMHDFILEMNVSIKEAIMYLHGHDSGNTNNSFKNGDLKIKDLKYSKWIASKINQIKAINKTLGFRFSNIVLSLVSAQKIDVDELIHKIKIQPTKLVRCANSKQTRALIEDIYNYKRRNKVNLRM